MTIDKGKLGKVALYGGLLVIGLIVVLWAVRGMGQGQGQGSFYPQTVAMSPTTAYPVPGFGLTGVQGKGSGGVPSAGSTLDTGARMPTDANVENDLMQSFLNSQPTPGPQMPTDANVENDLLSNITTPTPQPPQPAQPEMTTVIQYH